MNPDETLQPNIKLILNPKNYNIRLEWTSLFHTLHIRRAMDPIVKAQQFVSDFGSVPSWQYDIAVFEVNAPEAVRKDAVEVRNISKEEESKGFSIFSISLVRENTKDRNKQPIFSTYSSPQLRLSGIQSAFWTGKLENYQGKPGISGMGIRDRKKGAVSSKVVGIHSGIIPDLGTFPPTSHATIILSNLYIMVIENIKIFIPSYSELEKLPNYRQEINFKP
jgi:hypothetical protein